MNSLEELKRDIEELKNRNKSVDLNKKWEVSIERKVLVVIITYIIMSLVMYSLWMNKPFLNALIPTLWYFLSTLSLEFAKKIYINKKQK